MMTKEPTPEQVRGARKLAGLTQAEAATLVHVTDRQWRNWEAGAGGMPLAKWELFAIKVASLRGGA